LPAVAFRDGGWVTRARFAQRSGYSRLLICNDLRRAIQLQLRAHLLNLRRLFFYSGHESLNLPLLLRDCRSQLRNSRLLVIDFASLDFEFSVFLQNSLSNIAFTAS
jgi:hypothetical protein